MLRGYKQTNKQTNKQNKQTNKQNGWIQQSINQARWAPTPPPSLVLLAF
jgi:hypothetical protein